LEDTVKQLKGSRKTTTRSAEETYNALEKFGTDLVALAEEGKLDPVIGRCAGAQPSVYLGTM
jgi:ATP-dependent Clp protease ATP-binding subunit ClpB